MTPSIIFNVVVLSTALYSVICLSTSGGSAHSSSSQDLSPTPPCSIPQNKDAVFCQINASLDERLNDLLHRIPLNETPGLFINSAFGVPSLGLPPYEWWSEGLHGVALSPGVNFSGLFPAATSFPQVCTTAASFNATLFSVIGNVVGMEGRAMNNFQHAGLTYWAPNINIYRDPRWGRGQETPGEDPLLTSRYAANFVRAMQNNSMDPNRLRVSSCCKHFAAYDMENSDGQNRNSFDAIVSDYDYNNTYLVAFQSCIHKDGGAASGVMCSYNAENGVPSCANHHLLTELARNAWGFDGYITSDCGAVGDVLYQHQYTKTTGQTLNVTIGAGMDLDCGIMVALELMNATDRGDLQVSAVYDALRHQYAVLMRLGYFDPVETQPYKSLGPLDVNTEHAQAAALEAAEQGIVLLNYNVSYLPWNLEALRGGRVAIMGNNADNGVAMQGNYFGDAPYLITPRQGLERLLNASDTTIEYIQVLQSPTDMNTTAYDAACRAAQIADVTVLVIGNDQSVESEGHDRTSIAFPGNQILFVHTIATCANNVGKQITVVAFSGGSLDYNPIMEEPGVGAILWAGYPGQSGGLALAKILVGEISPSGRVPTTIYPSHFVNNVQMINMHMEANATIGSPGFTYRYYTADDVVYPFGWGLTYTNWTLVVVHSELDIPQTRQEAQARLDEHRRHRRLATEAAVGTMVVNITNTGSRASAFSLLCKVTYDPPGPNIGGTLSDFEKVFLEPGMSTLVSLRLTAHAVSVNGMETLTSGLHHVSVVGFDEPLVSFVW
jgi:beta-glucosidase-like glycosyl hydrolase